jgi:hypothetical protein
VDSGRLKFARSHIHHQDASRANTIVAGGRRLRRAFDTTMLRGRLRDSKQARLPFAPLMSPLRYSEPVQRLFSLGRTRVGDEWTDGNPDYVAEFGLTPAHVPELLRIIESWADDDRESQNDDETYAPIHAWRAAAQLGALEAVPVILGMQNHLEEAGGDDWSLEDHPRFFEVIGPAAIPPLSAFLADASNLEYPRVVTAHGLRRIASRHPQSREEVVQILTRQLETRERGQYVLNGAIIADLLELGAVESAEAIERAYSAGVVDIGYVGDWSDVQGELGVEGLDLPQPPNPYDSMADFRSTMAASGPVIAQYDRRKKKKKLPAILKKARKKRK